MSRVNSLKKIPSLTIATESSGVTIWLCHSGSDQARAVAQAEQDFKQLVATVEQLQEAGPTSGADSALNAAAMTQAAAAQTWVNPQAMDNDKHQLREALELSRRRIATLEGEVARLRRQVEERGRNLLLGSASGSGSRASQDVLLQSLLASTDSDVASQVHYAGLNRNHRPCVSA